ncbi:D-tyrosyl-tRNA(Tyr) deacylase [Malassezia psittaci]|uniref:D-aminoacyl-tRNA deacylase n=1 Tax=Malassezia psittaci TaxID=1821823 RepID=A0AAF0JCR6_9BASI|nr:D-tyrosyl-tRNA(Tyr) deacylase [Malassezia psittaci]
MKKILNLKLWPENSRIENGRLIQESADGKAWSMNVTDLDGEILCVSQFTLYAKTAKGTKPDFHRAMRSEASRDFYNAFLSRLRDTYQPDKIKG